MVIPYSYVPRHNQGSVPYEALTIKNINNNYNNHQNQKKQPISTVSCICNAVINKNINDINKHRWICSHSCM